MRKKVVLQTNEYEVLENSLHENTPIFAMKDEELKGMVIKEMRAWILNLGGSTGACGYSDTRHACMQKASQYGYTFIIE